MELKEKYKLIATDPNNSVWVSASAGTGKTTILVERILRLLLNNVAIDKILCITFTKVAASEMVNRLMDVLAKWSIIEESVLIKELETLTGKAPTKEEITLARSLLHEVLEVKEHIKINTIHSFCQFVLNKFPLEAGIHYNFAVIEEEDDKNLQQQSINFILNSFCLFYEVSKKFEFPAELSTLIYNINERELFTKFKKALQQAEVLEKLNAYLNNNLTVEENSNKLKNEIFASYEISTLDTIESIKNKYLQNLLPLLAGFIKLLQEKKSLGIKFNDIYEKLLQLLQNPSSIYNKNFDEFIANFKLIFFTKQNEKRKSIDNLEETVKVVVEKYLQDLSIFLNKINAINCANLDYSFNIILIQIYKKYIELKSQNSLLTYNDLLLKTVKLLQQENISSWFLYKLDSTIEHLLVDEAQDTSQLQWEIIKLISLEFFAGESIKQNRTIFIVGDIKQSIYGFQGADPNIFFNVFEDFNTKLKHINKELKQINTNVSYRSTQAIIESVNSISYDIFDKNLPYYKDQELTHISNKPNEIGFFEILPTIYNLNSEEKTKDNKTELKPKKKSCYKYMALTIVNKIIDLNKNYGVNYNNIAILYKKRENNKILNPLLKICKDNNIPIALDKIDLKSNIFMQDIISLVQFLLQPNDNFALSCVLKSPFFNLDDNNLMEIRYFNINNYMFNNLQQMPSYTNIVNILNNWLLMSKNENIVSLFSNILYKEQYIQAFKIRLNKQVEDIASEFYNLIINFYNNNNATLQHLLKYLKDSALSIKIDNSSNNYINLLTVHASKGAQFDAVFVLDDIEANNKSRINEIYINKENVNCPFFVLYQKKYSKTTLFNALETQNNKNLQEENKRLLYVAITRAKNFVFFCSIIDNKSSMGNNKNYENSWYTLVNNACLKNSNFTNYNFELKDSIFKELNVSEADVINLKKAFSKNSNNELQSFGLRLNLDAKKIHNYSNNSNINFNVINFINENPWVKEQIALENDIITPISPSKLNWVDKVVGNSPLNTYNTSKDTSFSVANLQSGVLLHKILEHIENAEDKENYIDIILNSSNLANNIKQNIKQSVLNLLNSSIFKQIFMQGDLLGASKSFNEVAVVGVLKNNEVINARIDKLIVSNNEIIVVDYKMSFGNSKNYNIYKPQMQAYKELLKQVYPNYTIRAYAIFTSNLQIKEY